MKWLAISAVLLVVGGCTTTTTSNQYSVAQSYCGANGGLREVKKTAFKSYFVCKNGAKFELGTTP